MYAPQQHAHGSTMQQPHEHLAGVLVSACGQPTGRNVHAKAKPQRVALAVAAPTRIVATSKAARVLHVPAASAFCAKHFLKMKIAYRSIPLPAAALAMPFPRNRAPRAKRGGQAHRLIGLHSVAAAARFDAAADFAAASLVETWRAPTRQSSSLPTACHAHVQQSVMQQLLQHTMGLDVILRSSALEHKEQARR